MSQCIGMTYEETIGFIRGYLHTLNIHKSREEIVEAIDKMVESGWLKECSKHKGRYISTTWRKPR